MPSADAIPWSLADTSPSGHNLCSPNLALSPKRILSMHEFPSEKYSVVHDTHDQAQSEKVAKN